MVPQRIRQVKREIRVLGVAAARDASGFTIVGAVYRGALWLDGVLRAHSEGEDLTEAVAGMLARSPHSGQVRVIILSRQLLPEGANVFTPGLSEATGKPVILLGGEGAYVATLGGERVPFSAEGLSRWSAEGVLKASTREGATPEALRVAALTLSVTAAAEDA